MDQRRFALREQIFPCSFFPQETDKENTFADSSDVKFSFKNVVTGLLVACPLGG
jgi:hypothetical protein